MRGHVLPPPRCHRSWPPPSPRSPPPRVPRRAPRRRPAPAPTSSRRRATCTQVAQATLCLLNDERAAAGLPPLTIAQGLTQPSAAYSARMVTENFFAHVAPTARRLTDRLEDAGYIAPDGDWTVGENIAWGQGNLATARNIMVAWMNSPGHRAQHPRAGEYTEVGVGIVPGTPGDTSWGATYTTDFGAVAGGASDAVATAAVAGTKASSRKAAKAAKARSAARPAPPGSAQRASSAARAPRPSASRPARGPARTTARKGR